ncbi:MAG: hypothetical protein JTT11_10385, partial [Candidatus Brockarchaeota archaeon]|nr:hypothetical protein [Candidatus Brockarchaeota archaeon]
GASSTAVAALLSIVVILILVRASSSPKGAEEVFWAEFGFVKWLAELLRVDEYLKDFEEFLEYVQGTELWPLIVSILSMVCMVFSVLGAFLGTKVAVGVTTRMLAWRRGSGEEHRAVGEEKDKVYKLRNERRGIIDYPEQPDFESRHGGYYAGQQTFGGMKPKESGRYGEDVAEEQLQQVELSRDRIIEPEGDVHFAVRNIARLWLLSRGETIQRENDYEPNPISGLALTEYGKLDISTQNYLVELKKGTIDELDRAERQALRFIALRDELREKGAKKTLIYWFAQEPTNLRWRKIIRILKDNGVKIKYGGE